MFRAVFVSPARTGASPALGPLLSSLLYSQCLADTRRSMGISRMRGLSRKGRVGGVFGHLVRSVPEACEANDVLLSGSGFTVCLSETEHAGGPLVTPCFSFPLRWWRTGSWGTRRGRLRKCFTAHCVSRSSCASTGWRLTWRRTRITR